MITRTLAVVLAVLALAACQREERRFEPPVGSTISAPPVRMSEIQPSATDTSTTIAPRYEVNAYALAEGKRLFAWYNCNGCHAEGGGGQGPALMDDVWTYGSSPANVFASIVQGRPNGMPSWGGRIAADQIWMLVTYVRSLGAGKDVSSEHFTGRTVERTGH